jgi:hypothetical protein
MFLLRLMLQFLIKFYLFNNLPIHGLLVFRYLRESFMWLDERLPHCGVCGMRHFGLTPDEVAFFPVVLNGDIDSGGVCVEQHGYCLLHPV